MSRPPVGSAYTVEAIAAMMQAISKKIFNLLLIISSLVVGKSVHPHSSATFEPLNLSRAAHETDEAVAMMAFGRTR
jgi:hypothetical protein